MSNLQKNKIVSLFISVGEYKNFIKEILILSRKKSSSYVCIANVHMTIEAYLNKEFAEIVNGAEIVTPDGMPLAKGIKIIYGLNQDRVAGMDLIEDLFKECEIYKKTIFIYGSTDDTLKKLKIKTSNDFSKLLLTTYSPPFRQLTKEEKEYDIKMINNLNPDFVFVALGCPKQDKEKRNIIWLLKQIIIPIKLFFVLLTNKVDIFHLNAPLDKIAVFRDFVLLLVSKLFRKKVLMHFHGGKYLITPPKNKLFVKFLSFYFNMADSILTLSEYEKVLTNKLYNIPLKKISFLENCVIPLDDVKKNKNKIPRITFLGRIVESKGINEITSAMKELYKVRKDFEFYLYGTGPLEDYIINELSLALNNSFQYKGIVSGEKKDIALKETDIFILPSLYGEGLPIALLEAMNSNNICIVTNDGSMATVIENEQNGFIVEKGNSKDLLEKLKDSIDLIKNGEFKIQKNAKKSVLEKYNCYNYSIQLKNIYKKII